MICATGSLSPRNHVPVTGQREHGVGFFTPVEGQHVHLRSWALRALSCTVALVYQKGSLAMIHQRSPPLKVSPTSLPQVQEPQLTRSQ